jgi:hypothetical protein
MPKPEARSPKPVCQFVNLRMRTLITSPNAVSVAIIEEPP